MRKLVLAVAVAMASGKAFALGLGEIKLNSALNEPFSAEIQLITDRPAELEGAMVRLAPQDAFRQAGLEWPAVLGDLKFTVTKEGVVKVTSSQPVREPFLDFIVQLQWPAGRLLREYTVLLDPPLFSGEKAAPAAAPVTVAPPVSSLQAPAVSAVASTPPVAPVIKSKSTVRPVAPATTRAAPVAGTYGPTQPSDTAWAVAQQVRPDPNVTVQQAMLALLEANPEAFYGRNVNNLLAGYVLRVPSRELMATVPAQAAEREVSQQYQQWRQAKSGVPMTADVQKPAQPKTATSPDAIAAASNTGDQSSRLRLAAPGEAKATAPGVGNGQSIDKLRNDLSIALESADAARRENEELRSRLSALEGQINSMQRLMTLKDGSLAELQNQPGEEVQAPLPGTAPTAATEVTPSVEPPQSSQAAPEPAPKPAPTERPAPEPATENDLLADPMLFGALGGVALLLLAVAWLVARRRRSEEDEETRFEPIVAEAAAEVAAMQQAARPNTVEAAVAAGQVAPTPQMAAVADEVARSAEGAGAHTASDLDMMHTAEGDIDPIVEADVYLAYRRYQQAEALIQTALAKEPQRLEFKVKLLEIYYAARNVESFQRAAETLHNELWQNPDDSLWQRVVAMGGELLPNHVLFNGAASPRESGAATAGAGAALFAAGNATAKSDMDAASADDDDYFGFNTAETRPSDKAHQVEESLDLDLNADEAHLLNGDGLGETVAGSTGEVPDVETGKDVLAAAAKPSTSKKDDEMSWATEPALSDFGNMDFNLDDADFLAGTDVVGTKLDLARAYIDMGDDESAREILKEVLMEGNDQQKLEAQTLSQQLA